MIFGKRELGMELFSMRGRWYRSQKKSTVDDHLCLDIGSIKQKIGLDLPVYAILRWQWGNRKEHKAAIGIIVVPGHGLRLCYQFNGEAVEPCIVRIIYTQPHFGGRRPWFLCPGCGKRVRLLYSGKLFLCRNCLGLSYAVRQRSHDDALLTAIWSQKYAIIQRLGSPGSTLPSKPPYMHQCTYSRLAKEFQDLTQLEIRVQTAAMAHAVGMDIPALENLRNEWKELKAWRKNRCLTSLPAEERENHNQRVRAQ
jgi:hypothetical protein